MKIIRLKNPFGRYKDTQHTYGAIERLLQRSIEERLSCSVTDNSIYDPYYTYTFPFGDEHIRIIENRDQP